MGFFKDIKEKLVGKSTKQNEKYVAGLDKSSSSFSDRPLRPDSVRPQ